MIRKIKGTMDIFPEDAALFQYIEGVMREQAQSFGFGEIRTPTFENTELFVRGVGDTTDVVQKEMYTFADRDENRSISLRPEGTASVVRALIENGKCSEAMPLKYYYIICFVGEDAVSENSYKKRKQKSKSDNTYKKNNRKLFCGIIFPWCFINGSSRKR